MMRELCALCWGVGLGAWIVFAAVVRAPAEFRARVEFTVCVCAGVLLWGLAGMAIFLGTWPK